MSNLTKLGIVGTVLYLVVVELALWGHTHHWASDFMDYNAIIILSVGWLPIFILFMLGADQ